MIKLEKKEKPDKLRENAEQWTKDYLAHFLKKDNIYNRIQGLKIPKSIEGRYGHQTIKKVLLEETEEKCAYCESKILHNSPGDIEHIYPKRTRPDLAFEWTNLTLACSKCNTSGKGGYYDPALPLINPYVDDPLNHFYGLRALVLPMPQDLRAIKTHNILKINRLPLYEKRKELLDDTSNLVSALSMIPDERKEKESIKKFIIEKTHPKKEFSFIIREYLKQVCFI
ncbi:HNH endonuclease [Bacillus sp. AFS002410]|uniref:HNH endonuclease n=1 Tax=Bacillus sp. AFS002410 TaxID=2033481 RepID=UPI0015CF3DF6|nr:HNH endonuclease [Bacillus sp. AFS002410]